MKRLVVLCATASALAIAAPANAVLLQFTISGVDTTGTVEFASFRIDSNPVIAAADAFAAQGFFVRSVAGTYRYGSTTVTTPQTISFYTTSLSGGLFVGDGSLLAFDGPQLYTGTEAAPMFRTGVFTLFDYYDGAPISLTVAPVAVAVVPEPATWGMLVLGFGLVGGMARRRRTVARAA